MDSPSIHRKKVEKKKLIKKDTCTPIFTAELFTVGKSWKQP